MKNTDPQVKTVIKPVVQSSIKINQLQPKSKLNRESDVSYDPGFYKEAIKPGDTYDAKDWNRKGNALYNLKKYDEAIKCYDKAIEINFIQHNTNTNVRILLTAPTLHESQKRPNF